MFFECVGLNIYLDICYFRWIFLGGLGSGDYGMLKVSVGIDYRVRVNSLD